MVCPAGSVRTSAAVAQVQSPGSGITDWVEKMSEYADAGIPHYWIVESYIDRSLHLYTSS